MRVKLDYGREGLWAELPERQVVGVLEQRPRPPLVDPEATVRDALAMPTEALPLTELARGKRSACIVVSDLTRPVPNRILLPAILEALGEGGLSPQAVTILVATGLHRPMTDAELAEMLGPEVMGAVRVVNHDGRDREAHHHLGTTDRGTPVWMDATYCDAELRVVTGLIEPHLMAGYSGGRKVVAIGLAHRDTIGVLHSPVFLEAPTATEGVMAGNPLHEELVTIAQRVGVDFLVNVTVDRSRRITSVNAGDLVGAHEAGVAELEAQVTAHLPAPADVVITTSAGYPLDLTFYQAVKGLTAALPVVREGGTIVLAAQCAEGIGGSEFTERLRACPSPAAFEAEMADPTRFTIDQWQIEELCKVLRVARVRLVADGLAAGGDDIFVEQAESIETAVADAGAEASIAVIPEGPYVLPRVERPAV